MPARKGTAVIDAAADLNNIECTLIFLYTHYCLDQMSVTIARLV